MSFRMLFAMSCLFAGLALLVPVAFPQFGLMPDPNHRFDITLPGALVCLAILIVALFRFGRRGFWFAIPVVVSLYWFGQFFWLWYEIMEACRLYQRCP